MKILKKLICKKCNTVNFADAKFCRNCGNLLRNNFNEIKINSSKFTNDDFTLSTPVGGPTWKFQLIISELANKYCKKYLNYFRYINKHKFLKTLLFAIILVKNTYKDFVFDKNNNKLALLYIFTYTLNFLIGYILSLGFKANFLLIAFFLSLTELFIIISKVFVLFFLTHLFTKISLPNDLFLRLISITCAPLFLTFIPYSWEILKIYLFFTQAIGIRDITNCSTFKSFLMSLCLSLVDIIIWGTLSPQIHSI